MKKNNIITNTIYAFLLQFTNLLFPVITSPYISRVLGTDRLGSVNLSNSVANWFTIFALFGTTSYGIREVAKIRNNPKQLNAFFSEMIVFKLIATIITLSVYLPLIFSVEKFSYEAQLYLLQGVSIFLNIFSFDWFFQGVEEYKYITTRSVFLKILSLCCLFVFIKTENDYVFLVGISIITLALANLLNFKYSLKFVKISFKDLNLKKHLKPLFIFLTSAFVISIYGILDNVFLGFIKSNTDVAFFTRAMTVLMICMSLTSTINNVIMPRLNNHFANNKEKYDELLRLTIDVVLMISIPIMFGVIILADDLMLLLGNEAFLPASYALVIMSPIVVLVPVSVWNYHQRMLPNNLEKTGLLIQAVTALISILMNYILIPYWGFIGAAVTHLFIDIFGLVASSIYLFRKDKFRIYILAYNAYWLAGIIMTTCIYILKSYFSVSWFSLLFYMLTGAVIYLLILLCFKNRTASLLTKKMFAKFN